MNGQVSFFEGSEKLTIDKPIRLIELFAGIGAQAKALENLGVPFEHYRICEFDRFAVQSYNAVHYTDFAPSDVTKIHGEDLGIVDTDKFAYLLTYSFPCTDLSKAGKQKGMSRDSGTRSGLLWQVERLLKETKELPQILLMENVPDVVSDKNIRDFAEWIAFLDHLGYTSKYEILNAKNYGVPQNRERCFMVSWLGDAYYDFPTPIPLTKRLKDVLEDEVDQKYYLSDEQVQNLLKSTYHQTAASIVDLTERERVAPTLCARDYKGPKCVKLSVAEAVEASTRNTPGTSLSSGGGDGIYTGTSEKFRRPPLKDMSRCLKAESHDAGVVLYE